MIELHSYKSGLEELTAKINEGVDAVHAALGDLPDREQLVVALVYAELIRSVLARWPEDRVGETVNWDELAKNAWKLSACLWANEPTVGTDSKGAITT
jgi:hypothetical protein